MQSASLSLLSTEPLGVAEMAEDFLLSTKDNPFNPYEQWNEWYAYDERMGYHTSGLIARVIVTSNELSEEDQKLAYEQAADFIIDNIDSSLYKKIYQPENEPV